ncbi:hypothetical protein [Flavobacterium sp.]|jgi:hypothetical protein|uniref:hypothetical protein n=1 Tax=Flavobacterium sp. TaxID=239 RepID=UPI0037C11EC6
MENRVKKNIWVVTCSYGVYSDSHTIRLRNLLYNFDSSIYNLKIISPGPISNGLKINEYAEEIFLDTPLFFKILKFLKNFRFFGIFLEWLFRNLFYRFAFPDLFMFWDFTVINYFRNNKDNLPDIVISASGSPVVHVAILKLRKLYKFLWIADFGDPWFIVDKQLRPFYAPFSKKNEKKIISVSDHTLLTSHLTLREYENIYDNFSKNKAHIFPYGFLNKDINSFNTNDFDKNKFNISHVGTAHKSDRNLLPLFEVLNGLENENKFKPFYNFILAGNYSIDFKKYLINSIITSNILGKVSFYDSIQIMGNSQLNIIVGNFNGIQIPGKVFMCLSIPVPILYIAQTDSDSDEAMKYLSLFQGIVYCENNIESIRFQILNIVSNIDMLKKQSLERVKSDTLLKLEGVSLSTQLEEIIVNRQI